MRTGQSNLNAAKMLFEDASGLPTVNAINGAIQASIASSLLGLLEVAIERNEREKGL